VYEQLVRLLAQGRKNPQTPDGLPRPAVSARQAVFLFLRRFEKLSGQERETLLMLPQFHPQVDLASDRVQQFREMLHEREGVRLESWLAQVNQSSIPQLQSFAAGVEKDKEAVRAGLTWWINNGVVEGHVTKLKLIKRQGYGQAGFPLRGPRVLHAVCFSLLWRARSCQTQREDEMGISGVGIAVAIFLIESFMAKQNPSVNRVSPGFSLFSVNISSHHSASCKPRSPIGYFTHPSHPNKAQWALSKKSSASLAS
jgi:hypothetical protein